MCPLFTFLVSLDIHTLQDLGVGERCLRGLGEADLDLCDLLYRSRDLDHEVLVSLWLSSGPLYLFWSVC